jgi:amino acid adenylation domain-containing protein
MQHLLGEWLDLLTQFPGKAQCPLQTLEILAPAERQLFLHAWNATDVAPAPALCAHQLIEASVARGPERVAVRCAEAFLTYGALDRLASHLAALLCARGIGPEVCVGLSLERSPELLIALLAILKAGGAYVPLDAGQPAARLALLVREARVRCLLTCRQSLPTELPQDICVLALEQHWSASASYPPRVQVEAENLAYVIYTSGSTGQPKGVMVSHRGLVNYLAWAASAYQVAQGSGTLVHSPLTFDLTLTGLLVPLVAGAPVHLLAGGQDAQALGEALLASEELSLLKLTPAHLELLRSQLSIGQLAGRTRALIIGGEALLAETVDLWRRYAPATRLVNEYGPTETVVGCCVYTVDETTPTRGPLPIGRPIANTRLYVLDRAMHLVPRGVTGELYIGGESLARGYSADPGLTAARFVPDPFSSEAGARLYMTGDLVRYLPGGVLLYVGRSDTQLKIRGYRIEPGEIEAALLHHPLVREAVVEAGESPDGQRRLLAYVGCAGVTVAELRAFLQEQLPAYLLPSAYLLVATLPLTPHGKVDRQALAGQLAAQEAQCPDPYVPATPLEELVTGAWCEVLGRRAVDLHENFFQVGGHSLLATRLIARLQALLGVEVSLRGLFNAPTIADLVGLVEQTLRGSARRPLLPLTAVPRGQDLPLSFAQQRLWFVEQLDPGNVAYLMPVARSLHGALDSRALERSLAALLGRHESLRTTFHLQGEEPVQRIHPPERRWLPLVDLTHLPASRGAEQAHLLAAQEAAQPCDLARGPLLRVYLLRLQADAHIFLLTLHHIISDGWSNELLYRELIALHTAFASGQPSPLAPLPIQYADYALWQRQAGQEETLAAQLAYWRTHLADLPVLDWPTDAPRPPRQSFRGATLGCGLPAELQEGLLALSRQQGVTLFMLLLAAFGVLLTRLCGQEDLCVGSATGSGPRSRG